MNNNCNHVVAYDVAAQLFAAEDGHLHQPAELSDYLPTAEVVE